MRSCLGGSMPMNMLRASSSGKISANTVTPPDRKSTRLNSSHLGISYAVFCLKKKNRHILERSYLLVMQAAVHKLAQVKHNLLKPRKHLINHTDNDHMLHVVASSDRRRGTTQD